MRSLARTCSCFILAFSALAVSAPACTPARSPANGADAPQASPEVNLPLKARFSAPVLVRPSEASDDASRGWITLSEPLPQSAALVAVRRLCLAIASESVADLTRVLVDGAWVEVQGERRAALSTWTTRFAQMPYQLVPCERSMDLEGVKLLDPTTSSLPNEALAVSENAELVAVVRISQTQVNGERLFGPRLIIGLRPEGSEYRISAMAEP